MGLTVTIILSIAAYLLGSVPTAYILVLRLTGQDIRRLGTGNVGTLNTYHQVGLGGGAVILLLDTGKGVLAVFVPAWLDAPEWAVFLTTIMVLAGHNWPVFLGFRGGKGAAAIFGISIAFVPLLTLITLGPTVIVSLLLRNVVLGVAFGFVMLNTLLFFTDHDPQHIALCIFLTVVVTATYLISIRAHIVGCIQSRRWKELFTELA